VTVILNPLQSSSSSSSSGQTAYPSAEYVDLGLKVKATPRLHGDDEVTLHLEFDIRSLAGAAINGIPILSNRTIDQTIRLRENQTSVLSGLIETNEARTISGLPWSAMAPDIGYLTGERTADTKDTEMLIIVTPRALRLPPRNPRAIYAGHGEPSSPATPFAPPPGVPPQPAPPPGAQPPPSPGAQPVPPPPGGFPQPRLGPPG
jgi:general secretion pathway protein D